MTKFGNALFITTPTFCFLSPHSLSVVSLSLSQLNREYVLECFMADNPILRDKIMYAFEAATNDKVSTLSKDHEAELYLNKVR